MSKRKFPIDTAGAEEAIIDLLKSLGFDPNDDSLNETPKRVMHAWLELLSGYGMEPGIILSKRFEAGAPAMISLLNIPFNSTCEHHLMPFTGKVSIAYLPADLEVVGLSKLARLVECFALRLQIQERMGNEIADELVYHLKPKGVAVVIRAEHSCMTCRGVKKSGAMMITQTLRGAFKDDAIIRAEVLGLLRNGG